MLRKIFLIISFIWLQIFTVSASAEIKHSPVFKYSTFDILQSDGKKLTHFHSFLRIEKKEANVSMITSYFDTRDSRDIYFPNQVETVTELPDQKNFILRGVNQGINYNGIMRLEEELGGRKKIHMERHFTNWWSLSGDAYVESDGTQNSHFELRKQSGELVYTYLQNTRAASTSEVVRIEKRLNEAHRLANGTKPSLDIPFDYQKVGFTFPGIME